MATNTTTNPLHSILNEASKGDATLWLKGEQAYNLEMLKPGSTKQKAYEAARIAATPSEVVVTKRSRNPFKRLTGFSSRHPYLWYVPMWIIIIGAVGMFVASIIAWILHFVVVSPLDLPFFLVISIASIIVGFFYGIIVAGNSLRPAHAEHEGDEGIPTNPAVLNGISIPHSA